MRQQKGPHRRRRPDDDIQSLQKFVRSLSPQDKAEKANWVFDKWIAECSKAIDEALLEGNAMGEPYVLVMQDDGKSQVHLDLLSAVNCGRWFAEQLEPATQIVWTELQAEMANNPTKIPMVIRSRLFEITGWRLL